MVPKFETNNTVTNLLYFVTNYAEYGTTPTSFLATKCLQQCGADKFHHEFPITSKVLKSDFIMDDLMSGAKNIEEAKTLQKDFRKLLQLGGFRLRK